ncbi:MAG TPA: sulfite exporter TauE/SafE family protein [Dehalococcoidia bacterium]|nr:sulfite exporter TauE/SafE family protein [Dehalococcoidia bacterium]
MLTVTHILILLAAGAGTGFASGLLGIGGGAVMVPVIYWLALAMDVAPDIAIRIAFGTSLLVILPTVISGSWRHNKKKAVRWKTALILGSSALVGGLVGASLAAHLPEKILTVGFGGLILAVALWMGLGIMPKLGREDAEPRENLVLVAACGFPIGIVSGLTGIGGGVLIVAVLVLALNFPMHTAVGTSVASIILASLGGIVGYIVNGLGVSGLLPYSLGYVNLPIWLCLAATSIPVAQLGARAAHALPAKPLTYIFIAFMVYASLEMLGVLDWIQGL